MTSSRLARFKDAQAQHVSGFESALSEIHSGGKRSHWIWYVFPQLSGMGYSAPSRTYGLDGVREAEEYLRIRYCVRVCWKSPRRSPARSTVV